MDEGKRLSWASAWCALLAAILIGVIDYVTNVRRIAADTHMLSRAFH
jgi:hypothetical protein